MANFAGLSIFSAKMRLRLTWNGQFSPDSQLFPSFTTKASHFWRNLKSALFYGGYISQIFWVLSTFSNHFTPEQAQNDPQWRILPKKWLRLAQNSQFWSFCRFFHLFPQNQAQIYLEWLITRFTTFPIFYHHSISFLEKSQKFSFLGGGTSANFLSFSTVLNHFTPKWLKMTHNGEFCHQSGLDELKMGNFG